MEFTVADLKRAAALLASAGERAAEELNAQDGKLGDGDLGITVRQGWRAVADAADTFPDDLGLAFLAASKAFQRVSSSSFGTLVATALLTAAKTTKGRTSIPFGEIPALLASARDAMMARGKAALGDKTLLDSIDAIVRATEGIADAAPMLAAANAAAEAALRDFTARPNRIGRARMFADSSVGIDDPGMLAVRRMVAGLES
jgi:dihydroxyacetone kinase-like protein